MKIRTRAYLLGLIPALLVAVILSGYLIVHRLNDMESSLKERGGVLARYVAQGVEYGVVSGNLEPLSRLLAWTVQERDVVHAGVYWPDGALIAEAGHVPDNLHPPLKTGMVETEGGLVVSLPVLFAPLTIEDPFFQEQAAVVQRPIAWVRVAISRAGNTVIVRDLLLATLGIVVLGMLFAAVLVRSLALVGIQPLMDIIAAVRGIAAGNFRVRLPLTAKSELMDLQQGINKMSDSLQSFQNDMQQRVDAATAELATQKETAERANQAKSKFLAAASHDLRQPMHAIALYVAFMKSQVEGRMAAITLGKIEVAVAAMENLFSAILDVSKLDAGVVVPEVSRVSVKLLLGRLYDDFHQEAAAKGLQLRLRYSRDAFLESDPVLLGRILRNLISNALRYTERGGILVAARRRGQLIRLQVWDTGQGIPAEHLEHIFQEFFQVSNPHRDRSQGLGLGLAIVDRLARLLGHPMMVRSVPGRGTVFCLDVPVSRGDPVEAPGNGEALHWSARLQGLVAVVDDDAMVLDSLASLLEGWGLQVIVAASTTELLKVLRHAPDILITDYRLRGEDGLEVANALRKTYPDADFQLIVITGDTTGQGMRALAGNGYHLMHKPVNPARLRTLMSHLLMKGTGHDHTGNSVR